MMPRALVFAVLALLLGSAAAHAQDISVNFGDEGALSVRAVQLLVVLTLLSLAPGILVMVTCFPFIVTVLAILRQALGLMQSPPNMLIVSLALFLTYFVMEPVFIAAWQGGIIPLNEGVIGPEDAFVQVMEPFRLFMLARADAATFESLASLRPGVDPPGGNSTSRSLASIWPPGDTCTALTTASRSACRPVSIFIASIVSNRSPGLTLGPHGPRRMPRHRHRRADMGGIAASALGA
jgi:flagellar biosynthesis protein FliP